MCFKHDTFHNLFIIFLNVGKIAEHHQAPCSSSCSYGQDSKDRYQLHFHCGTFRFTMHRPLDVQFILRAQGHSLLSPEMQSLLLEGNNSNSLLCPDVVSLSGLGKLCLRWSLKISISCIFLSFNLMSNKLSVNSYFMRDF